MIPKVAIITALLVVVAVLAFAGLAYQTVPTSTTQTITLESTETRKSYSLYLVANRPTYTTTSVSMITVTSTGGEAGCLYDQYGCIPWYVSVYYSSVTFMNTRQSTYETLTTTVIPYSQTVTSSVTQSSTSIVPASAALGLTDGSYSGLALVVFGTLAVLAGWVIFNPIMDMGQPKQATLTQFTSVPTSCIKCDAEIPPASAFCDRCGAKQD